MKKIALVIPNNIWVSPYLSIYTRMFDNKGVAYDIISWNREGRDEEGIQFQYKEKSRNLLAVLWSYLKYARFLLSRFVVRTKTDICHKIQKGTLQ